MSWWEALSVFVEKESLAALAQETQVFLEKKYRERSLNVVIFFISKTTKKRSV